jgi:aspartyl-tRNA(Asn)/glutamyl-tRNA(Gln) amidotransferase subunit C
MKFSREQTLEIARLARLHLEEEDLVKYQDDLGSILEYVAKLQQINTDHVPEFQHAAGGANIWRKDAVEACDPEVRRRALENFSTREGDLLKVQAVFEHRE